MLASRVMDLIGHSNRDRPWLPAMFVTYSLITESAATYRSLAEKGLKPVLLTPPKSKGGGGRRSGLRALSDQVKIRWEYGPESRPADLDLLKLVVMEPPGARLIPGPITVQPGHQTDLVIFKAEPNRYLIGHLVSPDEVVSNGESYATLYKAAVKLLEFIRSPQ